MLWLRALIHWYAGEPNRRREQALQDRAVRRHLASGRTPPVHAVHRFYEALTDPKTWLFALFSALDNVPNSLTNQRQIITASFGFSNLQTTLLGCVDGLIEIVTIFTGVRLAARYKDSRAYVGAIYFVPNILGVLLINFLPWENKVGLLFSQWLTGACIRDIVTLRWFSCGG